METLLGIDLVMLVKTVGYVGLTAIVFAESGLLFGFLFPGDSLLFTAGFLASQGFFSMPLLYILCFIAAVFGDNIGYWFGKRLGPAFFTREDSLFFRKTYVEQAAIFYYRHGPLTLVLARFMPIIRTFVPILAGVGRMRYSRFLFWNVLGGALWTIGLPTFGFLLGSIIPDPDRYLLPVILLIILSSVLPPFVAALRRGMHNRLWNALRSRIYRPRP